MSPVPGGTHLRADGPTAASEVTAPPLVLVHGVGLDLHMWDLMVDDLAVGRRVVRYDLLGHGGSGDPPGPRSLDDFVDQCLEVLDAAAGDDPDGRTPDLAGLSIGGLIAMAVAARHPDSVGRLVAMNTVFERTAEQVSGARVRLAMTEAEGMGPVADLGIDRWFSADWQADHPDRVADIDRRIRTNDVTAYLKAYRVFVDGDPTMPAAAAGIAVPVLAMTGGDDPGSTPAMSRTIASAVPDGRCRILSGLRHLPPVEAPGDCSATLLDFLDEPATHRPPTGHPKGDDQ